MVRIIAQMIDVDTEEVLWSDTYVRDLTSMLKLHSEVAQAIVNEVSVLASPAELEQLKAAPLVNADSYEDLLKGRHILKFFVNGGPNNCFAKSFDLIDSQVASTLLAHWFSNPRPF